MKVFLDEMNFGIGRLRSKNVENEQAKMFYLIILKDRSRSVDV